MRLMKGRRKPNNRIKNISKELEDIEVLKKKSLLKRCADEEIRLIDPREFISL